MKIINQKLSDGRHMAILLMMGGTFQGIAGTRKAARKAAARAANMVIR